jgi:hypothetical protein
VGSQKSKNSSKKSSPSSDIDISESNSSFANSSDTRKMISNRIEEEKKRHLKLEENSDEYTNLRLPPIIQNNKALAFKNMEIFEMPENLPP